MMDSSRKAGPEAGSALALYVATIRRSDPPRIIEVLRIKQESMMFCSLCWTHVIHLDGFEESVLAMTSMRAAISGKLNKKDSINIIRNLDE